MLVPIFIGGYRTKLRRMHATPLDWANLALGIPWVLAAWLLPEIPGT